MFGFNCDHRNYNFTNEDLSLLFFIYYFSPLLQYEVTCLIAMVASSAWNFGECSSYVTKSNLVTHLINLMDTTNRNIFEQASLAIENILRKMPSVLDEALKQDALKSLSKFIDPSQSVSNSFYGKKKIHL